MNKSLSAWSVLVLGLLMIALLAGCGGVSANPRPTPTPTPMPTPPGATPTPTPAAPHGTFVYSNSLDSGSLTGYRLNGDGTLTAIPGSPFPANGSLAVSGGFLVSAKGNNVTTFRIDPSSGSLTAAGSATVPGVITVAADAANAYVAGALTPAGTGTGIYGFSLSSTGALNSTAGSPYFFDGGCFFCESPNSLALNNRVLALGGSGFHSVGDFTTYARGAAGVLGKPQSLGTGEQIAVTIQRPTGKFAFAIDGSDSMLSEYSIDATGSPTLVTSIFPGAAFFIDETLDPAGKFLLALDQAGAMHVFTVDQTTGAFSQIGTSESVGNGARAISIDPSGHFLIVAQGTINASPPAANQITVFTFDPATGATKKLQSYPVSTNPSQVAIASL